MTREIKFRVWDKEKKEIVRISRLNFSGDTPPISLIRRGETTSSPIDRYELMQYTGLLDKNGKEIYAGDILKRWHYSLSGKWIPRYFGKTKYKIVEWTITITDSGFNIGKNRMKITQIDNSRVTFEVIGNIYENPELLNNP